ncbi:LOW QUALITY PROTEIN: latherin-like [Mirounga angustirostris]|uniref:LOW QUALITY PROTEIN: latherin-like n=1 Tax=Mirounga angustirostris TaxID=9716 RepID=UPI001E68CDCC|nr:LOW QUALITY PROTEIN: latherin-like [Mirounga angustirostris]
MLKVSSLFILFCGLLASSSAQEALSRVSSQITNALTQELLGTNILSALQTIDFQGSLKNVFILARGNQHPGGLLTNRGANLTVQIKDLRLLQVCLENSPNFKGVKLRTPLAFSIQIKFLALNPCIFHVRTDMRVQLYLEKGEDSKYQLAFGHCRIAIWTNYSHFYNFSLHVTPMKQIIVENVDRVLRDLIINNLGAKTCTFINSHLYNLNPQVTNKLISLLLQQGRYQATIQISPK